MVSLLPRPGASQHALAMLVLLPRLEDRSSGVHAMLHFRDFGGLMLSIVFLSEQQCLQPLRATLPSLCCGSAPSMHLSCPVCPGAHFPTSPWLRMGGLHAK